MDINLKELEDKFMRNYDIVDNVLPHATWDNLLECQEHGEAMYELEACFRTLLDYTKKLLNK